MAATDRRIEQAQVIGILSGSLRGGPFRGSIMKGMRMNVDMNLVADKLREARGFIAKPGTWAQTATAFGPAWRGAGLSPCNVMDP